MDVSGQGEKDEIQQTLETMTVEELRGFAKNENIDIGNAKKKGEILAAIQEALVEV